MRRVAAAAALVLLSGCATAGQPLRILVYNIHAGKDASGADNLQRVARLIGQIDPDLVLLQEVDRGTARSGGADHLAILMELTGMHGAFGKSLDYQGGEYGIATLSRWPITRQAVIPLRTDPPQARAGGSIEPRIALLTVTRDMTIFNTHLDASRDDTWRLQEVAQLLASVAHEEPLLAGGDFNAEPGSAVHARLTDSGLRDAWLQCGSGDGLTFSAAQPVKRIDYVFLRGARCAAARVISSDASDHLPLLVEATRR